MSKEEQKESFSNMDMMPPAIKSLLLLNVALFLLTILFLTSFQFNLVEYLGLFHPDSEQFALYQFFTHLFMHGSGLHIFLNMFVLWMFGSVLEHIWGMKKFLVYFLFTGLGAAILHTGVRTIQVNNLEEATKQYVAAPSYKDFKQFREDKMGLLPRSMQERVKKLNNKWQDEPNNPNYIQQSKTLVRDYLDLYTNMPTVGASGAVYGVLMAFGILFPNIYVYLYLLIPIRAKYFVMMLIILQLYLGFFDKTSNVANFAHLGGMLFGYILLKYWGVKPMTIVRE